MPKGDEIPRDPLDAVRLWTYFVHARAGANPDYPLIQRVAVQKALRGRDFAETVLSDVAYPTDVWREFGVLASGRVNRQITEGIVRDFLVRLRMERSANWILFLKKKSPESAFEWLDDVRGVGEKLAAFVMRDLTTIFKVWTTRAVSGCSHLLQPVDRWVRFWANLLWFEGALRGSSLSEMKSVTTHCQTEGVDPMAFNKGAWFVGAYMEDLCDLFGLDEACKLDYLGSLTTLDPDRVRRAIQEYARLLDEKEIVAV